MPHARKQIREAVKTALAGLPTTGSNVFTSRYYPLEQASLPGLIIMTPADEGDYEQSSGSAGRVKIMSRLQLIVKAHCKGLSNIDDVLDQIELEVRETLAADITLGGKAKDLNWLRTETLLEGSGEQPIGVAEIMFLVNYRVADNAPGTILT